MAKVSTSFKPGQSGNPNGRPPKGYSITEWFKQLLEADPATKEVLGQKILQKAQEGDIAALKMVWQYMDGMPQQDITSDGEKIEGVIIYTPEKNTE